MGQRTSHTSGGTLPSGPSGVEWLDLARRFGRDDLVELFDVVCRRHGTTVHLRPPFFGEDIVLLTEPAHVEYVLETNKANFRKAALYRDELSRVFGDGLLTSDGELWARQNRTIAPMFVPEAVHEFGDLVLRETDAMLDRWAERAVHDEPIDLLAEAERVTLLIIGKALFSEDMSAHAAEMSDALAALRASFKRRTEGLLRAPSWLPTPGNERAARARRFLDELVYNLIEDRRGAANEYDDLLSRLLLAEDHETGKQMDDEQVRDEVVTFLLAGHETTAAALTWTWWLLARHPRVHETLSEHLVDASIGDPDVTFDPTLLEELGYVRQVLREGMRLYPPVPHFAREAVDTTTVGGHRIPEGSLVVLSQYLTHRNPDVWEQPTSFEPRRFDDGTDADRPRYAFYPFGGGPRSCIGREFALLEAQLVLARAETRCSLELLDAGEVPDVSSAVTMTPTPSPEMEVNFRSS